MGLKRALITGVDGFTGFYVAKELERAGFLVFGISNHSCNLSRCHQADLLDRPALTKIVREVRPTVVVHLAAIAFVGHGSAEAFYQVNLMGTRNLLEALATEASGLECVLLASSANVYGNSVEGLLDEGTLPNPANDYAVSKLAMEYMARLWQERLPIVIARPFNYTGVGQSPQFLLPKIVGHFQRGEKSIELGNIDVERDFSDVRLVAQVYRSLLQAAPVGEVFNVCSGTAWALKDVLAMMAEIAGYEIDVRVNPAFVRANEVKRLQGDAGKLERLIGKLPSIPFKETLGWMYSEGKW